MKPHLHRESRLCRRPTSNSANLAFSMDARCGNDSSSSGVISDQSASLRSQPASCSSVSSYSSSSRRHSAGSTVLPSPTASVHWGETRVHTYEREETDTEEPAGIVEIDVDSVVDAKPPPAYVETNLDAAEVRCPACVFDCGPIHPYLQNARLQPSQCIHEPPPPPAAPAEAASPFCRLPQPLLGAVLALLGAPDRCRAARVCKRWYRTAWAPALWPAVVVERRRHEPWVDADRGLRTITKILSYNSYPVCSEVTHVAVPENDSLTDRGLIAVARRCPELRSVDIHGCPRVSNLAVFELVSRCPGLQHLNVSGCDQVSCISLTPEAALSPHPGLPLARLDLSGCPRVDDGALSLVASHCPALSHLYLRRCAQLSDHGVHLVARFCRALRELSLNECPRLSDAAIADAGRLPLRYLSAAKCAQVSDRGVAALGRCPRLRYLNLRACPRVSDTGVEAVAAGCPRLRFLDLGGCDVSDDSLAALGRRCPGLRRLSVRACDAVTDGGVAALARGCPGLLLLNVAECSVTAGGHDTVRQSCPACIIEHNSL